MLGVEEATSILKFLSLVELFLVEIEGVRLVLFFGQTFIDPTHLLNSWLLCFRLCFMCGEWVCDNGGKWDFVLDKR